MRGLFEQASGVGFERPALRGGYAGELGLDFGPDVARNGRDRLPSCGKSPTLPQQWKQINLVPHDDPYVAEPFRQLAVPVVKPWKCLAHSNSRETGLWEVSASRCANDPFRAASLASVAQTFVSTTNSQIPISVDICISKRHCFM